MVIKINFDAIFIIGAIFVVVSAIGMILTYGNFGYWWFYGLILIANLMLWAKSIVKWIRKRFGK